MQIRPTRSIGAKIAERAPTTTWASPRAIRSRSSRRSASLRPECRIATESPKRPRGSRAVVLGDPERQVDERRRQLVYDTLDRQGPDSRRRRLDNLDNHPARPRAAEGHGHNRALIRAVWEHVGELARAERTRADERNNGPKPGHTTEARRRPRRARSSWRSRAGARAVDPRQSPS